jgi:hypothetical protein
MLRLPVWHEPELLRQALQLITSSTRGNP